VNLREIGRSRFNDKERMPMHLIDQLIPMLSTTMLAVQDAAAATPTVAVLTDRSLFGYIAAGGVVAIILIMLSVVALALVVANLIAVRRDAMAKPEVIVGLEGFLRERRVEQAIAFCKLPESDCFLARVVGAGLSKSARSQFGYLELKPAMEEAGAREAERLDRLNYALRVVSDLAPMLGLLGTVIGIIKAFATIGAAEGVARSTQLSNNMSEALVNTALGLGIAIPCLVMHAFFKRRIDGLVTEVGDIAERLAMMAQGGAGQAIAGQGAGRSVGPAGVASGPRPVSAAVTASGGQGS